MDEGKRLPDARCLAGIEVKKAALSGKRPFATTCLRSESYILGTDNATKALLSRKYRRATVLSACKADFGNYQVVVAERLIPPYVTIHGFETIVMEDVINPHQPAVRAAPAATCRAESIR